MKCRHILPGRTPASEQVDNYEAVGIKDKRAAAGEQHRAGYGCKYAEYNTDQPTVLLPLSDHPQANAGKQRGAQAYEQPLLARGIKCHRPWKARPDILDVGFHSTALRQTQRACESAFLRLRCRLRAAFFSRTAH